MNPGHIALALGVTGLWGFGFVASKVGVTHIPPLFFLALRFAAVAAVLIGLVPLPRAEFGRVALISTTFGLGHFALFFVGLRLGVGASTAALLWQLQVPFTVLLAVVWLGERPGAVALVGMGVAFTGAGLMAGAPSVGGSILGMALVILSVVMYAVANIQIKRARETDALALNAWIAALAAPQLMVLSWLVEKDQVQSLLHAPWEGLAALGYMIVGPSILGYTGWYFLIRRYPVSQVTSFILLVPVAGAISGTLALGERPGALAILGGIATVAGVALVLRRRPVPVDEGP